MPPATFLLPNYDEYLIAYKDRGLVQPRGEVIGDGIMKGPDAFAHPLVVDGLLAGFWRRRVSGAKTSVEVVVQSTVVSEAAESRERSRRSAQDILREGLSLVGRV